MLTGLKVVRVPCEIQLTLLRNSGVVDHSEGRTIPDISSSCCSKQYPRARHGRHRADNNYVVWGKDSETQIKSFYKFKRRRELDGSAMIEHCYYTMKGGTLQIRRATTMRT